MYRFQARLLLLPMMVLLLLLTGCGVDQGVNIPGGEQRHNVRHRYEFELIPNAELAVESTTPDWALGRHVFTRGPDRLLVITRITSFPVRRGEPSHGYRDERIERVWVNIPLDVPVGQQFTLEESFRDFHVGYDRAQAPKIDAFYIRAVKPLGTVQMVAQRDNEVDVRLDIRVRPEMDLEWHIRDTVTAPFYESGKWAKEYVDPNFQLASTNPTQTVDPSVLEGSDAVEPTEAETEAVEDPQAPAQTEEQLAAAREAIQGRWINDDATASFELRLQFEKDGTFIFGSTRGGGNYAPGMKYGTYQLRGNTLVMRTERYEFDGRDHMRFSSNHTIVLRHYFVDNDLILDGDFGGREGRRTVRMRRGSYPDMNFVLPPRGRSGQYQF